MGSDALKGARNVHESVVLGPDAGKDHRTGEHNIFIGRKAGEKSGGSTNIYVGSGAGRGAAGAGNIFIGENVTHPTSSNLCMIGRGENIPLIASFDTGVVQVPTLHVIGNIEYGGSIVGPTPPHVLVKRETNTGNPNSGSYSVGFGEYTGNAGDYNVMLGYCAGREATGGSGVLIGKRAGEYSTGKDSVAIGSQAGSRNTGNNVIAIGSRAGMNNTEDNKLFVGDFITADSSLMTIHREVAAAGWKVGSGYMSASGVSITSSNITLGESHITASSNRVTVSDPIIVKNALPKHAEHTIYQTHKGLFVNNAYIRPPFKILLRWNNMHVGLDRHVYISTTGRTWRPLRSPALTCLTVDTELIGYGEGNFYVYKDGEWSIQERADKGEYECHHMSGPYAFGTPLSNPYYEDSGTILFRSGDEWRLYPGVYTGTYEFAQEIDGAIYVGGHNGNAKLEFRREVPVDTNLSRHTDYPFIEYGSFDDADLTVPKSIRMGSHRLISDGGLHITDGIYTGTIYDTVLNPLPIELEGIKSVKLKMSGGRLFVEVDSSEGISSHSVGFL